MSIRPKGRGAGDYGARTSLVPPSRAYPEPEDEVEVPIEPDDGIPDFAYAYANFATGFYWVNGAEVGIESFLSTNPPVYGEWVANDGGIVPGSGLASNYTETTFQGHPIIHPDIFSVMMENGNWSMLAVCNVPVITPFTGNDIIRIQPYDSATVGEWDDVHLDPSIQDGYNYDFTCDVTEVAAQISLLKFNDFGLQDVEQADIFTLEPIIGIGYKLSRLQEPTGFRGFMCTTNAPSVDTINKTPPTVPDELALVVSSFENAAFIRTLTLYDHALSDDELVALAIEASI